MLARWEADRPNLQLFISALTETRDIMRAEVKRLQGVVSDLQNPRETLGGGVKSGFNVIQVRARPHRYLGAVCTISSVYIKPYRKHQ